MATWTNVGKPGAPVYDDTTTTYDSTTVQYDGGGSSTTYTNIPKPT